MTAMITKSCKPWSRTRDGAGQRDNKAIERQCVTAFRRRESKADDEEILSLDCHFLDHFLWAGSFARVRARVATHDREEKISLSVEDARLQAAIGKDAEAKQRLSEVLAEAKKANLVPLQFEATLALGEIEIKTMPATGKKRLAALEQAARRKGFLRIAHKAATARRKS